MSKLIKLISTFIVLSVVASHILLAQTPDEPNKNEVRLVEQTIIKEDRSVSPYLKVEYNNSVVSIEGSELKNTNIYILNLQGMVISQDSHYFGIIPDTYNMDAPSFPGKYYIVIDSPVLYAEGVFEIRK